MWNQIELFKQNMIKSCCSNLEKVTVQRFAFTLKLENLMWMKVVWFPKCRFVGAWFTVFLGGNSIENFLTQCSWFV